MSTELTLLPRVSYRDREITGPRIRGLVALLAGDLRTGCGTGRLVEGLWTDALPENPLKALQVVVSRARAQVGADVIVSTPNGYRLALAEDQVDAAAVLLRASAAAQQSRAGDHAAALVQAEAGLAFWGGSAPENDDNGDGDPVTALRAERAPVHRSLVRARGLALARLGRAAEAIEALLPVAVARPRDEEVLLELLRAEAATAGPAAALARYDRYRRALRDELGADPGPALQAAHRRLLEGAGPVVRRGVQHEPNELLGRDDDIATVVDLLRTSRVTAIVGPGGLGKTRLAHVVSRRAEQRTVQFVGLAGVTADEDVTAEVASAFGVGDPNRPRLDLVAGIVEALHDGPVLLVLDNCEQVLTGVAELVRTLVSMARELRVLVTSRSPLGLTSEAVYLLPELSLRTAVELFTQRARAARPDVELSEEAVRRLCGHLDGLPLAVELAAARVRVLSVAEIERRLGDRFALLRGGARDSPERHRTLRAVVDWSWNLLDPAAQEALCALAVFPSGFTAEAALCLIDDELVLEELVEQSLLKVAETAAGVRFRMLETVREFGAEKQTDERWVDAFLTWARAYGLAHYGDAYTPDPYAAVAGIRAEQDNLVHALRLAIARDDPATVAAAGAVLGHLWLVETNYQRLVTMADEMSRPLSHYRPAREFVEVTRTALVHSVASTLVLEGARATRAVVALRRLPPAPPDTVARAAAVVIDAALFDEEKLFALARSDDPLVVAVATAITSYLWDNRGDHEAAYQAAIAMTKAVESAGLPWLAGLSHARAAEVCMQLDRAVEARQHLLTALPISEQLLAFADAAGLRWWLALCSLQLGEPEEAEQWMEPTTPELADSLAISAYGVAVRAEIQLARGETEAGLRSWRRVLDQVGDHRGLLPPGPDPWSIESTAIAVTAHARHGRLDLVASAAAEVEATLADWLRNPLVLPPTYLIEFPLLGALMVACATVDRARGHLVSAARLTALAERFVFVRTFQPTMSPVTVRQEALDADRPAYDDAVSSYAGLDRSGLRAAALAALSARPGPGRTASAPTGSRPH